MILYVNGCSHTAAAEAVNSCAFAEDDSRYNFLGRLPHPDNIAVSWGKVLADALKMGFKCDAESAASNDRIIRTTRNWIKQNPTALPKTIMIIQWSTWEREEWIIDGVEYQVNASGIDVVPPDYQQKYKDFVMSVDWQKVTEFRHQQIWEFHKELNELNIKHVFFNGNNHFENIPESNWHNWGVNYISPYDKSGTYHNYLTSNGFSPLPDSWHFGQEAHAAWAKFMLKYIVTNKLI